MLSPDTLSLMVDAETRTDHELLLLVAEQQAEMLAVFERFRPLLERYERAANANGFRQLRKVAKER